MTFKVGTKVVVTGDDAGVIAPGMVGTVVHFDDDLYLVRFAHRTDLHTGGVSSCNNCWWLLSEEIKAVAAPSIADDLRLHPQDKTVLRHLKQGKQITPMKALTVYGISRLAACIHNIRKAGYEVACTVVRDETGHRYAVYKLG